MRKLWALLVCLSACSNQATDPVTEVVSDYAIRKDDCGATLQLGTGATGPFVLTIPDPTGFPAGCKVTVVNADTGRGKRLSGPPVASFELPQLLFPKQSFIVQVVGTGWGVVKAPGRWLAQAETTFYLDAANGDDANDGLAPGRGGAWKTPQVAVRVLKQAVDFGLTSAGPIRVSLADSETPYLSSPSAGIWVNGPFVGAGSESSALSADSCPLVFEGNATHPENVVVSSATGTAVTAIGAAFICVQDMTLVGHISDIAAGGASVVRFGNVILGPTLGAKLRSGHGSAIENYAGTTIQLTGDSGSVFQGLVGGNVYITKARIMVGSDFAVSAFALAQSGGGVLFQGNTISGSGVVSGPKFRVESGGYIDTGTNNVELLPGSLPGQFAGGVYDAATQPATRGVK